MTASHLKTSTAMSHDGVFVNVLGSGQSAVEYNATSGLHEWICESALVSILVVTHCIYVPVSALPSIGMPFLHTTEMFNHIPKPFKEISHHIIVSSFLNIIVFPCYPVPCPVLLTQILNHSLVIP
jgi:hypothetical protein